MKDEYTGSAVVVESRSSDAGAVISAVSCVMISVIPAIYHDTVPPMHVPCSFSPLPRRFPLALACILAGSFAGLITGCAPVYYPNMLHAPLFSNAGETQLSGNITTTGYEAMAGVSPVENIGVTGAYAWSFLNRDSLPDDHARYGEIALCYYPSVDTLDRSWLRWEILGGYGIGSARSYSRDILHITYDGEPYTVRSEYQRAFIQGHLASQFQSR